VCLHEHDVVGLDLLADAVVDGGHGTRFLAGPGRRWGGQGAGFAAHPPAQRLMGELMLLRPRLAAKLLGDMWAR
jgi:hypothetical protein